MSDLFTKIETVHARTEGWCSLSKAQTLAAIVLATRPEISIELGVFYGRSLFPVAMAHQSVGKGRVIAIDPWMAENSVQGQVNPADKEWWGRQAMHQVAYDTFKARVYELGLQNVVQIERKSSDDFEPPDGIGNLHIDGNHGEQVLKDVERYAPKVKTGGFLILDDISWAGGFVEKGMNQLTGWGYELLYKVENKDENYAVFQKMRLV